jgi:hypothetical protein
MLLCPGFREEPKMRSDPFSIRLTDEQRKLLAKEAERRQKIAGVPVSLGKIIVLLAEERLGQIQQQAG